MEQHCVGTIPAPERDGKFFCARFGVARAEKQGAMTRSDERAALNEVLFREANEKIDRKGDELGYVGQIPFLCECEEPACSQVLRLEHDEYARARSNARRFLLAPGHETRGAKLVETNERFSIVEKTGIEAEIAEQHDPRSTA
jgi:hypothetical protein